jgi:predicted nucleic acid-binding protein
MGKEAFDGLFSLILRKVTLVPLETLTPFKNTAEEIIKQIDQKDCLFIACALAYPGSIFWSDDKALKRQDAIRVINTTELLAFLKISLPSD